MNIEICNKQYLNSCKGKKSRCGRENMLVEVSLLLFYYRDLTKITTATTINIQKKQKNKFKG